MCRQYSTVSEANLSHSISSANLDLSPCVGCNDNKSQRPQLPFKLFNNKDLGRCKAYKPQEPRNACYDACKTQWQWCRAHADTLKKKKHGSRHNNKKNGHKNRDYIKNLCDKQYSDCYKANANTNGDGKCKADNKKPQWESKGWYDWLNGWLGKWGFRN